MYNFFEKLCTKITRCKAHKILKRANKRKREESRIFSFHGNGSGFSGETKGLFPKNKLSLVAVTLHLRIYF